MAKTKTKKAARDELIRVLLTPEQKDKITKIATDAGLSVSSWALSVLLREAAAA